MFLVYFSRVQNSQTVRLHSITWARERTVSYSKSELTFKPTWSPDKNLLLISFLFNPTGRIKISTKRSKWGYIGNSNFRFKIRFIKNIENSKYDVILFDFIVVKIDFKNIWVRFQYDFACRQRVDQNFELREDYFSKSLYSSQKWTLQNKRFFNEYFEDNSKVTHLT